MIPVPFKGQSRAGTGADSVLRVAAIYGANASGKTNVLRALEFMRAAVVESHSFWRPGGGVPPRQPFMSSDDSLPTRFLMDFELDGTRHQYGFAVTSAEVDEEWLHVFPKGRRQVWFSRQAGTEFAFGDRLKGENETIRALTRRNSLFLSTAAQNNHEQLSPAYRWFSEHVSVLEGNGELRSRSLSRLSKDPVSVEKLRRYLGKADLGVVDVEFQSPVTLGSPVTFEQMLKTFPAVRLLHQIGDKTIPFERDQESDGTLAYLSLLGPIMEKLATGGLLCVDELDASLHPLLVAEIIKLFREPPSEAKLAQLIFTAHNTNPISALARDQIWFTEKDNKGASQLYPLSDFKPRRQENLELGYVQGRYGAIPLLPSTGEADESA